LDGLGSGGGLVRVSQPPCDVGHKLGRDMRFV